MERCPLTIPLYTRMPKRLYTATGNDVPRQSIIILSRAKLISALFCAPEVATF